MKKAKLIKGADGVLLVQRVYPDAKGKPFPIMHPDAAKCYVDVPDWVRVNMVWSEEQQTFVKREKKPLPPRHPLLKLMADKLGVPYEEFKAELDEYKKPK